MQQDFEILKNNISLFAELINPEDSEEDILRLVSELIKYSPVLE